MKNEEEVKLGETMAEEDKNLLEEHKDQVSPD